LELILLSSNLRSRWEGNGEDEIAIDVQTNKVVVRVDPRYFRPAEVEYVTKYLLSFHPEFNSLSLLLGNPAKAERALGWKRRIDFEALVTEMVTADLKASASLVEDQN
jgi:GDPmannose 4,6-dehydratase